MPSFYVKAASFADREDAQATYKQIRDILHRHNRVSLSAYCYWHLIHLKWCVAIVGNRPGSQRIVSLIEAPLARGQAFKPDDREVAKLVNRRLAKGQEGKFTEEHYEEGDPL